MLNLATLPPTKKKSKVFFFLRKGGTQSKRGGPKPPFLCAPLCPFHCKFPQGDREFVGIFCTTFSESLASFSQSNCSIHRLCLSQSVPLSINLAPHVFILNSQVFKIYLEIIFDFKSFIPVALQLT